MVTMLSGHKTNLSDIPIQVLQKNQDLKITLEKSIHNNFRYYFQTFQV